ncbi:EAL domain-containing protein [Cohnella endophytica]|uniref:EAL domain-containing protein n=1 Tax=Cohnella endophytica TaxID=2419778 RepID=A0A494X657_9BACL|nr:EAL domain-containing protein [Cohnella endophytica]RKP45802.1 EAL domain-containing protein [Cohnella endophytica]
MSRYHDLFSTAPLKDFGLVEFAADDMASRRIIGNAIEEFASHEQPPLSARYDNSQQLLMLMSKLQRKLPVGDAESVRCRISCDSDNNAENDQHASDGWFPLSGLFGEVGGKSVSETILYRLFTTYLQPIVQLNGNVVGYEFLLRPMPEQMPFRPAELFDKARKIGQHSFLDRAARQSAIRMGASHLQEGVKRFINFLPSSLHRPSACLQGTFELMKEVGTDPGDYVFEVIETEPLDDPRLSDVFDVYRRQGARLALDDVGSGFATLNAVELLQPDYVKMDRRWISGCDKDPGKQRYIHNLLDRVSRFNGVVLAEGVEREAEWDYLRQAGVPLFQGYLFGRAMPVPSAVPAGVY